MTPLLTALSFIRSSRTTQAVLVVIACGLAALAFKLWLGGEKKQAAREAVTQERTGVLVETINRMEQADETRREIRDDRSRARYDECLQSARNPANCRRFLPE